MREDEGALILGYILMAHRLLYKSFKERPLEMDVDEPKVREKFIRQDTAHFGIGISALIALYTRLELKTSVEVNAMKLMGLLFVVLAPSMVIAQTAVKPRTVPRMEPVEAVRPNVTVNRAVEAAPKTAKSLEALKAQAANQNTQAATCSVGQFSDSLAKGTRYSSADAEFVVTQGLVTKGVCGSADGVLSFDTEARENLIGAALSVSMTFNGKKLNQLSGAEQGQLDQAWAKGLADAKNRNAANDNQVTVESRLAVAKQIKSACQIRN